MNATERKTPLTDTARMTERNGCVTTFQGHEVVKADHARALERQCQELVEAAVELRNRWYYTRDEALSWKQNDELVEKRVDDALANWKKLQEGKESK